MYILFSLLTYAFLCTQGEENHVQNGNPTGENDENYEDGSMNQNGPPPEVNTYWYSTNNVPVQNPPPTVRYTTYTTLPPTIESPIRRGTPIITRPPDRYVKLQVYEFLDFAPVILYHTYV